MLNSSALSLDLSNTHWMCSGLSPSKLVSIRQPMFLVFILTKAGYMTCYWLPSQYISVPPNGFSLGHCKILAYSMQCSGSLGIEAMVHMGKLICGSQMFI